MTNADVARALADERGRPADEGKIAKLLYGDRRPGRTFSIAIRNVFGTPIEAWDWPLPDGWLPHPPKPGESGPIATSESKATA